MPIIIDKNKNICTIKMDGVLIMDQLLQNFDAAVSHIDYKPGMGRLWDFREADLSIMTTDNIRIMAKYSQNFKEGINDVKVAFVVKRDLELGFSNMFKAFAVKAKTPIEIFKSIDEAKVWLSK